MYGHPRLWARMCVHTYLLARANTHNPVCDLGPICLCPPPEAPPLPRLSSLPPPPALWGQQVPARPFWPEATVRSILRDLKLPKAEGRGSECLALFVPGMAADHKGQGQL